MPCFSKIHSNRGKNIVTSSSVLIKNSVWHIPVIPHSAFKNWLLEFQQSHWPLVAEINGEPHLKMLRAI
jgi:hypothetical protein